MPIVAVAIVIGRSTTAKCAGAAASSSSVPCQRCRWSIELEVAHPFAFALAIPATILSIGMLGFVQAVAFVRFRTAWALGAALEYPVWLVCGFLVPLTEFPDWVRPISWALAPTWGMHAIREAALGGSPWPDAAMCLALGAAYLLIGIGILGTVLHAARSRASLSLT